MEFDNPRHLAETDWLAEHLDDPNLRVFEVTGMLTRDLVITT